MNALKGRLKRLERARAAALDDALRAELARLGVAGAEADELTRSLMQLDAAAPLAALRGLYAELEGLSDAELLALINRGRQVPERLTGAGGGGGAP